MTFFVEYDKQPQKFLEKADKHIAKRIMDKIETALAENPVPHDAKTIIGERANRVFRTQYSQMPFEPLQAMQDARALCSAAGQQ
jgi:hypothetical protein